MLWHQLRSPLLGLLLIAAVASYFVGERNDAVIIGVIVALSVSLGLVNECRAEKAAEALLTLAALGVVTAGALLPATGLANVLGFHPLPGGFFAALAVMVACYLILIEVGKRLFYGVAPAPTGLPALPVGHRHLRRRAAYFSTIANVGSS